MKPGKVGKKKGKHKSSKSKDSSISSQVEDVQVHTGLPPQVEGQLRCFCRVSVSQITWIIPNPPQVTHVRVKWWGEAGDGAIFRPVDVKHPDKVVPKITARYPVRSGPKQFAAYLSDMGSLLIEVLSGPSRIPVGRAEVPQISLLSSSYPISGSFPVFSSNEDKIAEIQLSVMLESLMASYDSMGSIPTTDISGHTVTSSQGPRSVLPKELQPSPYTHPTRNSTEDPFASPATNKTESRRGNDSMSSVRHLDDFEPADEERRLRPQENGDRVFITTSGDVIRTNPTGFSQTSHQPSVAAGRHPVKLDLAGPASGDLLGTLLDRGTKLREAMIVSSLTTEPTDPTSHDRPPLTTAPLDLPMTPSVTSSSKRHPDGTLYNGLSASARPPSPGKSHLPGESDLSDIEGRAVDLIMGQTITNKEYQYLRAFDSSPRSSISDDADLASDLGDPLHDDTIIQELFYKHSDSEDSIMSGISADESRIRSKSNCSITSVEDPGNMRPPSRRSSVSSGAELAALEKQIRAETPTKRKPRAKVKTKKTRVVKKRRRSRSVTGSVSSVSDSGDMSTPRSETSRVSFDMTPSDLDEPVVDKPPKAGVDGLSVERLTLLGRVHVARVTIDSLDLSSANLNVSTSSAKRGRVLKKGKPPKASPKPKKPCTYFIEYQFPVVATSRDKHAPNAMATEVMRVASKTVKESSVLFNHRSVFPIYFDGCVIEKWWKSALLFKVFSRTPGQKIPVQVGCCGVSLKSILKSESLSVNRSLEIRDGSRSANKRNSSWMDSCRGNLRVTVELASDSKDFSSVMARTKLAEMQGKVKIVPITPSPHTDPPPPPPSLPSPSSPLKPESQNYPMGLEAARKYKRLLAQKGVPSGISSQTEPQRTELSALGLGVAPPAARDPTYKQTVYPDSTHPGMHTDNIEAPTLYTMLLIPDGKNLTAEAVGPGHALSKQTVKLNHPSTKISGVEGRNLTTRNTYLVCRMFWCDDVVSSNVTWGTSEPHYGFLQVAPVLVTVSLLERMRNNFMIVEIWDKKTSAQNDKLVGIVKLSLHQFYMSFRDQKIAKSLLRSQFPVISVDNYLAIMDPFSGAQVGQLKVLLAMGSSEQVSYLQRLKVDQGIVSTPDRPLHFHERQDMVDKSPSTGGLLGAEAAVDHQFEVVVEGIRNLKLFEEMIWGEADCFVQYYFPAQAQSSSPGMQPQHAVCTLKSFRTATTLCLPDPTFHDVTRHHLVLPIGSPVQRQILSACSGSGHGSGGLPFEVWCRYYHPNVRDQVVAKGTLPLAKLCAMVTMQKKGETAVQTFSLPLTPAISQSNGHDPEKEAKVKESGLMDFTVTYKSQLSQSESGGLGSGKHQAQVCISVGVLRASGLKSAAEAVARLDSGMQYPAEVGVNTYIKVVFSFLSKEDERITRTVARSFAPEFSHHMDFPCSLLWTEADSDALSLTEILESGEVTLELWHQVPGLSSGVQEPEFLEDDDIKGRRLVTKTGDVLLGTSTIQLRALLTHRTGISGWYPVHTSTNQWSHNKDKNQLEEASPSGKGLGRVVGGVELSIKFAHHDDRERVIHAARGVGWSPLDVDVEEEAWESEDETVGRASQMQVSVDQACFPLLNAMIIGQNKLDHSARCYVRYKIYDRAAVVSKAHGLDHPEFGILRSKIKHKQLLQLPASSPFRWYLREERLEIQVWVSYGRQSEEQRPRHRDKLIGSAFIDMETLADPRRKQHQISGLYPLFKPGAASLGGAYLRAHISLKPLLGPVEQICQIEEGSDVVEDEDYDPNDSFHQVVTTAPRNEVIGQKEEPDTPTFAAHISVERAMHLPWVAEKHGSPSCEPNSYVSFQTSEVSRPVFTSVVVASEAPVWDFQIETQLTTELLFMESKHLVFKVWHKPDTASKEPDRSSDRVLGFVTVDLVPLTTGLQQICGWYNIMDFNGQCQGQIKVSVTPLESLSPFRSGLPSPLLDAHHAPFRSSVFYPPGFSGVTWSDQPPWAPSHSETSLPHFQEHYESVKHHHEMLQKQGQIKPPDDNQGEQPEVSLHWKPQLPDLREEPSSSKSFLFSALRKQLTELDEINDKFKARLAMPEPRHQDTQLHFRTERLPLFTRSDHPAENGQSAHLNLNSTIGANSYTSQSMGKDSARDSVSGQDSGNVTATHHETSNDLIGSHSAVPSGMSTQSGEVTGAIDQPVSNTMSSELDVPEDFLHNHVPPQIQELLQAARQLHQPPPEPQERAPATEELDLSSSDEEEEDRDNQQNYFHQYQEFLQDGGDNSSDDQEEEDDVDIITPRALNDISSKGPMTGEITGTSHMNRTGPHGTRHIFPSPIPELSSFSNTDSWLVEPQHTTNLAVSTPAEFDAEDYTHPTPMPFDIDSLSDCVEWENNSGEEFSDRPETVQDEKVRIKTVRHNLVAEDMNIVETTGRSQPSPESGHEDCQFSPRADYNNTENFVQFSHNSGQNSPWSSHNSGQNSPRSSRNDAQNSSRSSYNDAQNSSRSNRKGVQSSPRSNHNSSQNSPRSNHNGAQNSSRSNQNYGHSSPTPSHNNEQNSPRLNQNDEQNSLRSSHNGAVHSPRSDHNDTQSSAKSNLEEIHSSPRSNHSNRSQSSEVKVIKGLPPLSGPGWGQSKDTSSGTNSSLSTPRAPLGVITLDMSIKDEAAEIVQPKNAANKPNSAQNSDHSTPREGTLPHSQVPNFFPSAVQLEQSMKALQLVTCKPGQPLDETRLKEKASVAQEFVKKLSKGSSVTKTDKFQNSGLKNKPLPTADETKRIAKIFASKFA
ncbi:C2 domain-containing protein 3-like [Liolophura sinensis]|uniref:C2 domain-containing protein 3-like n=1 Tax=Liolophura sinensis TaxID=3198878 RepID=UPI00315833C2